MKLMKMLGIAAVAVAGLTALLGAGSASGSVLCTEPNKQVCPTAKVYDKKTHGKLTFSERNQKSSIWETTAGTTLDTCTESTWGGSTESVGGEGVPVSVTVEELTWGGCTTSATTVAKGELLIEDVKETDNGTVQVKGTEVTVSVSGISCVFGSASAIDVGTLVGGSEATIAINGVLPKKSGGVLCPEDVRWTAEKVHTDNMGHPLYLSPATD